MAKFKLKPGERELARTPSRWVAWTAYLVTLAAPSSLMLLFYFDDDGRMQEMWTWLYAILGATALQIPLLALIVRWRIMVTDRRFLYYDPSRAVEEMNLEDIHEVEQQPYVPNLVLRGDGREITIRCFDDDAERIVKALGRDPAEALA